MLQPSQVLQEDSENAAEQPATKSWVAYTETTNFPDLRQLALGDHLWDDISYSCTSFIFRHQQSILPSPAHPYLLHHQISQAQNRESTQSIGHGNVTHFESSHFQVHRTTSFDGHGDKRMGKKRAPISDTC